jgi:hypothetical protein
MPSTRDWQPSTYNARLTTTRAPGHSDCSAETVALDTFLAVQRDIAKLEADVADLERRLEAAASISQISDQVKLKTVELVTSVRAELHERSNSLDEPIALFGELGAEIYTDREATLLVDPTDKGILKVTPRVSGDASGPSWIPPAGSPPCAACPSWRRCPRPSTSSTPRPVPCTYRVIAEPRREHHVSDLDWRAARDHAEDTRRLLTSSVLRAMLPRQLQDHVLTEVALMRAVGAVPARHTSSTVEVVHQLARLEGDPGLRTHAGYLADFLTEAAKTSHGRLIFPSGYAQDYGRTDPLLTVYSLRGLALPDESTATSEDLDERLSMCVLYLAAWLTQRGMYLGDVNARKGIFIDEAWALSTFSTGRRFIDRAARDSRKHNTRVLMASQNPSDLLKLDLANLISAAFIGRLTDQDAQRDALRFLPGIRDGMGYDSIFGTLSRPTREGRRGSREFIFSDGTGGIERIRIDLSAHPRLLEALNTTAEPGKARNRIDRSPSPSLLEEGLKDENSAREVDREDARESA